MEKDRRSAPRARVKLPARWEGVVARESATVTDLSRSGCFVLSGGKVEVKELVWLEIQLTDQQKVNFWAEVVNEAPEIGFALKFNSSSPEDEAALAAFLEKIFYSRPTPSSKASISPRKLIVKKSDAKPSLEFFPT